MSGQDLGPIQRMEVSRLVKTLISKYWPHLSGAALAIVYFELPSLQAYVAAHPKSFFGVALAAIIGAYHLDSPTAK